MLLKKTNDTKKGLKIILLFLLIITFLTSMPVIANACDKEDGSNRTCTDINFNADCKKSCSVEHSVNQKNYCQLCGHIHKFSSLGDLQVSAYDTVLKANGDIFNFLYLCILD